MKLAEKQLWKAWFKNKVFVFLMFLLCIFTSFMYFFVHFSIDVNEKRMQQLLVLNEQQQLYRIGLSSNITLARNFLLGSLLLTGFVVGMFYYRFFKANKKQFGCLKTIGYTDMELVSVCMKATGLLAFVGAIIGFVAGYFSSDILIDANKTTYLIEDVQKGVSGITMFIGLFVPCIVLVILTYMMYGMIRGKESAVLITDASNRSGCSAVLRMADRVSGLFPKKQQMPVRLALRNLVALVLMILSIMLMLIMFQMAYALNKSSAYVKESQMEGRNYSYETVFDFMQQKGAADAILPETSDETAYAPYSKSECEIQLDQKKKERLTQTVGAFDGKQKLYELLDEKGEHIPFPNAGETVISEHIANVYQIRTNDIIRVWIGEKAYDLKVSAIARNAETNWIYMQKEQLNQILGYSEEAYCGILSNTAVSNENALVITKEERVDQLERNAVSNQMSAVICEVMGCVIGCILLVLAITLNFQSNLSDMRILHLLGYEKKEIRHLLVDVYKPIILVGFVLTLLPSMEIVKGILRSLSVQIGEYLRFQTGVAVCLVTFGIIWVIYFLIQGICGRIRETY